MNTNNSIELDFCVVTLRDDGILESRFDWETSYEIDSKNLKEISNAMTVLSQGERRGVLSIAGLYGSMTTDARNVDIKNTYNYTLALALVIHSLSQRLLSNFYFKIKKTAYPIKTFRTEAEAEEWLSQQIRMSQQAG